MTCTHIKDTKEAISNLINANIHKEVGPYLTPAEVKQFTHGYTFNSSEKEMNQLGKNIRVVNEIVLKEKLEEIKTLLSQCNCLDKKVREQEIEKSLESSKGKITSNTKKLENIVKNQTKDGNNCGREVSRLKKLYESLAISKKDNNKDEIRRITENIADVSGELIEKGVGFEDEEEISQLCEEIAKLKIEAELGRDLQTQARIEYFKN